MNTAICCIAKNENDYLLEWVNYHISLGFSHIHIYDNNDKEGENINDVLSEQIGVNVFIHDCRGKVAFQGSAYNMFYESHGKNYDWIAFIDIDEFITFSPESGITKISDYLDDKRFDEFQVIHINWMNYGDNDIIEHNSNLVLDRFTTPLPLDKHIQYEEFPENNHVKSIVRGGQLLQFANPHTPNCNLKICDELGIEVKGNKPFKDFTYEVLYIRHYVTKTIYEWIKKSSRGLATTSFYRYSPEKFFKYNETTEAKQRIIADYRLFQNIIMADYSSLIANLNEAKEMVHKLQKSKEYKLGRVLYAPLRKLKRIIK